MERVTANQTIIDAMAETSRILNRVSEIDRSLYGEGSNITALAEAQQKFYDELKKELIKILDGDIQEQRLM